MKDNNGVKIPCVYYYYLHSKLREGTRNGFISFKDAEKQMFLWRIPHRLRPLILKEMEKLKLLKIEKGKSIELLKTDFNIEHLGKYSEELGLF